VDLLVNRLGCRHTGAESSFDLSSCAQY
jgi:hypothetical protein